MRGTAMLTGKGVWLDARWFELDDLQQMVRLFAAAFPLERWTAQRFCDWADGDGRGCLVAVEPASRRVYAALLYAHRPEDDGVALNYLAVVEDARRQKIGTRLVRQLTGAGRRGRTRFVAEVCEYDTAAQLFFRSLGFKAVPPFVVEDALPGGRAAIPFRLEVPQPRRGRLHRASPAGV